MPNEMKVGFVREDADHYIVQTSGFEESILESGYQSQSLQNFNGLQVAFMPFDATPTVLNPLAAAIAENDYAIGVDALTKSRVQSIQDRYDVIGRQSQATVYDYQGLVADLKDLVHIALESPDESVGASDMNYSIASISRFQYLSSNSTLKRYEGTVERQPDRYRAIAARSDGVVLIRYFDRDIGSGFLFAPEKILTCRHVVNIYDGEPANIGVIFDYEKDNAGNAVSSTACAVTSILESTEPEIDLAVLQVTCPNGKNPSTDPERVLQFSLNNPKLDEPVYVVSHPEGKHQLVSDNNFLRYPHRVSKRTFDVIRNNLVMEHSEGSIIIEIFDKTYDQQQDGSYLYLSDGNRWDKTGNSQHIVGIPTLGLDANTAPGSSGAPVFYGRDDNVIGVIFAGADDFDRLGKYGLLRHEGALPASAAIKWLSSVGMMPSNE